MKLAEFNNSYTEDFQCVVKYFDDISQKTQHATVIEKVKNARGSWAVKLAGHNTLLPIRDVLDIEVTNKVWEF